MNKSAHFKSSSKQKLRTKKAEFMLTEDEYQLIDFYLRKYKITNRSRWFRETVLNYIFKNMDQDYPTLFSENEMRR
ncbi:hypothetical protein [Seramator thermalis]|jgi:hypothetical protein|uniref:hypothetical protein n=1 Tax=Seramator thermalis TaxID=2496270 RepID=UPI00101C24F4|nr:hypothetical protein [Seramator thermalis]